MAEKKRSLPKKVRDAPKKMTDEETPEETSARLDKDAEQDRVMNLEIQRYITETLPACGIRIFEIEREFWDFPALTVRWHEEEMVKDVVIVLNGVNRWMEITCDAEQPVRDANGDPYLRRFRCEEVGACDAHDLQMAKDLLWRAIMASGWILADLSLQELL